jgi:hypothetical protein
MLQDGINDEGGGQRGTNPRPIKVLLVVDEETQAIYDSFDKPWPTWGQFCDWVGGVFWSGVEYLYNNYGISYQVIGVEAWESPNGMDYWDMRIPVLGNFSKAYYGYDIIVLMSGQSPGNLPGVTSSADHYCAVNVDYYQVAQLVQHEASHLFSPAYHIPRSCVMNHGVILVTREYCTDCHNTMWANRFKYDAIAGYATNVTLWFESGGGASVTNPNGILGPTNDGNYVSLYSGNYNLGNFNKAVINVQVNKPPSTDAISGTVYLRACSGNSKGNHLYIFKSLDGVNWSATPILNTNLYSPFTLMDVNCGYVSNFKYLSIVVINDLQFEGTVYIDSIHVHG